MHGINGRDQVEILLMVGLLLVSIVLLLLSVGYLILLRKRQALILFSWCVLTLIAGTTVGMMNVLRSDGFNKDVIISIVVGFIMAAVGQVASASRNSRFYLIALFLSALSLAVVIVPECDLSRPYRDRGPLMATISNLFGVGSLVVGFAGKPQKPKKEPGDGVAP